MNKFFAAFLLLIATLNLSAPAFSKEAPSASENPVLEAQVQAIAVELRCLVCQNQTIADSHAELAIDLRNQIRSMLQAGRSQEDILGYMTDRYGDFVRYRPPFKSSTWLLWLGPLLLLAAGLVALFVVLRKRASDEPEASPETDHVSTIKDTP